MQSKGPGGRRHAGSKLSNAFRLATVSLVIAVALAWAGCSSGNSSNGGGPPNGGPDSSAGCGQAGQVCCPVGPGGPPGSCDGTNVCVNGTCTPSGSCGGAGEPCCPNSSCASGNVCLGDTCTASCGGPGLPDCSDGGPACSDAGTLAVGPLSVACGDAGFGSGDAAVCNDAGWCWSLPLAQGNPLVAVGGTSQSDVWAVGFLGTILHDTGSGWTPVASNTTSDLLSVYARTTTDAWAVGAADTILHWDGNAWSSQTGGLGADDLRGVWSSGPTDAWAVGGADDILHFDGSRWTVATPIPNGRFDAVWGSAPGDVWAAGWQICSANPTGQCGLIAHWDGNSWTPSLGPIDCAASAPLYFSIWGSASNDVWAVGGECPGGGQCGGSVIIHYDGSTWQAVLDESSSNAAFYGVGGTAANDVWAVGDRLAHWDGKQWTDLAVAQGQQGIYGFAPVNGVWASAPGDAWMVAAYGVEGSQPLHWNGTSLESPACELAPNVVSGVWGLDGGEPLAVGSLLYVDPLVPYAFQHGAQGWQVSPIPDDAGHASGLLAVWGAAANDVWAVGAHATAFHWNGVAWSLFPMPMPADVLGVWGSSTSDVWAVGPGAPGIAHWDGTAWSAPTNSTAAGAAVWGSASNDVWVVGGSGSIFHFDGTQWTSTGLDSYVSFAGVWGSSANDVWAVGTGPDFEAGVSDDEVVVARWNGATWSLTYGIAPGGLSAVWGTGPNDVWAVGAGGAHPELANAYDSNVGTIVHWDGSSWTLQPPIAGLPLAGIWGNGAGQIWAVGAGPEILERGP